MTFRTLPDNLDLCLTEITISNCICGLIPFFHVSLVSVLFLTMFLKRVATIRPPGLARMFASSIKDYPIDGFFNASTYAIVGASNKKGSLGHIIASNFVERYKGDVVFVNPKGS